MPESSILLVEDDPDCAEVMVEALEFEGFRVELATSAVELLHKLGTRRFDAVVTDVLLGERDGLELVVQLREGPLARVPVVLTTGRSRPDVLSRARAAGIAQVLFKPIDAEVVAIALRRAIAEAAVQDGEAAELA